MLVILPQLEGKDTLYLVVCIYICINMICVGRCLEWAAVLAIGVMEIECI